MVAFGWDVLDLLFQFSVLLEYQEIGTELEKLCWQ